ncbi:MAG: HlyD family efflux transporter periplasmic adaptor subunit [Planctomycetaceae bacterium]|nr:HlyD family efflux transporter periplasmic adaptor subunit [Planctomycetaceae bacterium]
MSDVDLPWKKRADLQITPHDGGGWVVKDPVLSRYALLDDVECCVLQSLDGRTSRTELVDRALRRFPGCLLTTEDLSAFLQSLAAHQFIRPLGPRSVVTPSSAKNPLLRLLQGAAGLLRLQVPLFNPSRMLDATLPSVRRLLNPLTMVLATAAIIFAGLLLLLRLQDVTRAFPSLQQLPSAGSVAVLLLIFIVVKLVHEMAHALAARHFGAECSECGLMLLIFTPVLYTNVTDSWTLPRWQRMCVTGAGIAVELLLASICLLLWWQATDSSLRFVLFNTAVLCSVNTLLFNGNPLLRFDGYFLLSDALAIPNLASRSSAVVREFFHALLTGQRQRAENERRGVLLTYGLASLCYRVALTLAIVSLVRVMAKEWHVEFLGSLVIWGLLLSSVFLPAVGFVAGVMATGAQASTWLSRSRPVLLLAVLAAICCVPMPRSILAPAIIEPTGNAVYAPLSGRIDCRVNTNAEVASGQTLAVLHNPDLLRAGQQYDASVARMQTQRRIIENDGGSETRALLPVVTASLQSAERQQALFAQELKSLTLDSPASGQLFGGPLRQSEETVDGEYWMAQPLSTGSSGRWVERGTLLAHVGTAWDCQAKVCVSESEIADVKIGQSVRVLLAGHEAIVPGRVMAVSREPLDALNEEFAVAGAVAGTVDRAGLRPTDTHYFVTVALEPRGPAPAMYQMADVRIQTAPRSLLQRLLRFVRASF